VKIDAEGGAGFAPEESLRLRRAAGGPGEQPWVVGGVTWRTFMEVLDTLANVSLATQSRLLLGQTG